MKHPVLASLLLAGTAALCGAQAPCYAENDGPAFLDNISMGGPNLLLAIKFQVPQLVTARRAEIFTGEQTGTNTLGIWSHDAAANQPLADLGTGSWSMNATNSWQGTDLPSFVLLQPNVPYWLVWGPINASQASRHPSGSGVVTQAYRGSFNGGSSWNGPFFAPWKLRIYAAPATPDFTLSLTHPGDGSFTLSLQNLSVNVFEGWTLISQDTSQPVGSGCFFGIVPDATTNAISTTFPAPVPGNPLHWPAQFPGVFPSVPFSVPAGTMTPLTGVTWDVVAVGLFSDGVSFGLHASSPLRVTWP